MKWNLKKKKKEKLKIQNQKEEKSAYKSREEWGKKEVSKIKKEIKRKGKKSCK